MGGGFRAAERRREREQKGHHFKSISFVRFSPPKRVHRDKKNKIKVHIHHRRFMTGYLFIYIFLTPPQVDHSN